MIERRIDSYYDENGATNPTYTDNGDGTFSKNVQLMGSLAKLPSLMINDIGSYNLLTQIITPSSQIVAAGTTVNLPYHNVDGYRNLSAIVCADSSNLSSNWKAQIEYAIPTTASFPLINGSNATAAGGTISFISSQSIIWPTTRIKLVNSDAVNALTVKYSGIYVE